MVENALSLSTGEDMKRLVLCLLLTGCVYDQPAWVRPGATKQEFAQDKYVCMKEATKPPQPSVTVNVGDDQPVGFWGGFVEARGNQPQRDTVLFKACMEAQGYEWGTRKIDMWTRKPVE